MDVITDMVIRFTVDDLRDMIFEKMRKNIPDIDIHQYEYEIITSLNGIVIHCRPVNRNQGDDVE